MYMGVFGEKDQAQHPAERSGLGRSVGDVCKDDTLRPQAPEAETHDALSGLSVHGVHPLDTWVRTAHGHGLRRFR